jgi:hypothetical protein
LPRLSDKPLGGRNVERKLHGVIFCFDTSAINQFNRIRERDTLADSLLMDHEVYISTLNVIEIGKTPDPELREQLRATAKWLAKDYHPLELTNHLVQQLCHAYQNGITELSWSIPQEREQFWTALSEPYAVGESERQELIEWVERLEAGQRESNARFKDEVDRIFASNPGKRPTTPGKLARLYMNNRMLLYEATSQIYKGATGRVLPLGRLETFLEAKPRIWALYLAAQAYSIFYNCVWTEGRQWAERHHRRNPVGLLDLWAAVYLAACDYFVTNDTRNGGQYNALRWLNQFNVRVPRARVITWSSFRRRAAAGEFRAA